MTSAIHETNTSTSTLASARQLSTLLSGRQIMHVGHLPPLTLLSQDLLPSVAYLTLDNSVVVEVRASTRGYPGNAGWWGIRRLLTLSDDMTVSFATTSFRCSGPDLLECSLHVRDKSGDHAELLMAFEGKPKTNVPVFNVRALP